MVKISQEVLDGIKFVRASGKTNMLDYYTVMELASNAGYHETVNWMQDNKRAYAEGVIMGFEVSEVEN